MGPGQVKSFKMALQVGPRVILGFSITTVCQPKIDMELCNFSVLFCNLQCLSKIGADLMLQIDSEKVNKLSANTASQYGQSFQHVDLDLLNQFILQICMKTYNSAKSAMFEVVLTPQFFDEYELRDAHPFECGVLTKASRCIEKKDRMRYMKIKSQQIHHFKHHNNIKCIWCILTAHTGIAENDQNPVFDN